MEKTKFCAVICEYNPFHNGHAYQLNEIRRLAGGRNILCVMSGNFTQRGEVAVFDKYTRARHAIEEGADAILELPAPFAVAPAQIFAEGAIHLISSLPCVDMLAFGCESGRAEDFLAVARATLDESKAFKEGLKEKLKQGLSFVRARTQTTVELNQDIDEALLTSPNNILGIEYCRAILRKGASITPLAIPRKGAGYSDEKAYLNFSSATALRACLNNESRSAKKLLKSNLPATVYRDVETYRPLPFAQAVLCSLLSTPADELKKTVDCTEGLENRLKSLAVTNPTLDGLLDKTVSKRYTRARLSRVLCANFLGVREKQVRSYLSSPLYLNLLAVKKTKAEELLVALQSGTFPLLVRKSDVAQLKKEAKSCYLCDTHANELYNALRGTPTNAFQTLFI